MRPYANLMCSISVYEVAARALRAQSPPGAPAYYHDALHEAAKDALVDLCTVFSRLAFHIGDYHDAVRAGSTRAHGIFSLLACVVHVLSSYADDLRPLIPSGLRACLDDFLTKIGNNTTGATHTSTIRYFCLRPGTKYWSPDNMYNEARTLVNSSETQAPGGVQEGHGKLQCVFFPIPLD